MATLDVKAQIALHERIVELCGSIAEKKVYFRAPDVVSTLPEHFSASSTKPYVQRDRVISALLRKAINTHKSVKVLCESGFADDGYALARVLFENMVTLGWLLVTDDWIARLDIYIMYMAAVRRRFRDVALAATEAGQASLGHCADLAGPNELAISAEIFNDGWSKWARKRQSDGTWKTVTFAEMCDDLKKSGKRGVEYDFLYFDMSTFIHSAATVAHQLDEGLRRYVRLPPDPEARKSAVCPLNREHVATARSCCRERQGRTGIGL